MPRGSQKKYSKKKFSNWFNILWPVFLIAGVVLLFFYPVWLRGHVPLPADIVVGAYHPWLDYKWGYSVGVPVKNPITTDVVSFSYPMRSLAIDLLKSGQLPLWNPYILMGTPLLANFQSAPFSPTNIVYFLFDKLTAWSLQVVLQHFFAAAFTYLLLRYWKVSRIASLMGGIIFAFSGFSIIWSQWNAHVLVAAFTPLLLLFVDKWVRRGLVVNGIFISIIIALQILSGYPQLVFYSLVSLGLLWFVRLEKSRKYLFRTFVLGIFILLGVGISAFQILPGAELLSLSQREIEPHPFDWAFLPFMKVITFLAPDFFGNHSTNNYWGPQDYTSNTGFVGVVAVTLALFSLSLLKKMPEVRFSFLLLVISLSLSFPSPLSIFLWKSGVFGFQAASAHRALVLFNFSVALLASFGADHFLKSKEVKWVKSILPSVIVLSSFFVYSFLFLYVLPQNSTVNPEKLFVGLKNLVFPVFILVVATITLWFASKRNEGKRLLFLTILFFIMTAELFRFGWKFTPFTPRHLAYPETPILSYLKSKEKPFRVTGSKVIPINMRMPYKLETPEGYDAVYPLKASRFLAVLNANDSSAGMVRRYALIDNDTSHLLDLLNTRYYLTLKKDDKNGPSLDGLRSKYDTNRFDVAFEDKSVAILESKSVLPRSFMVYDWEEIRHEENSLKVLLNPEFPFSTKVILEETVDAPRVLNKVDYRVVYRINKETESIVAVTTEKKGILFMSDAWYPGWQAYIDGQETKIYRANFAFRAVIVPEGKHEVRFIYQPKSFFDGFKISIASSIFLILIFAVQLLVGKKRASVYT